MIYTSYEMVQDCRAGSPAGWGYFVANYVPVIRKLLAHYFPERAGNAALPGRVLAALRRPDGLFATLEPAPERNFVAALRQAVLAAVEADQPSAAPDLVIGLAEVGEALAPLTLVEKQVVWLDVMHYEIPDAARMLRMDPNTAARIRARAADLLRAKVDAWSQTLLSDNGPQLGRAAAASAGAGCLPPKAFLDIIDGRTTWQGREAVDRQAGQCLHCLDHFCRMIEATDLMRAPAPLGPDEAEPYLRGLGIGAAKPSGWRRLFG